MYKKPSIAFAKFRLRRRVRIRLLEIPQYRFEDEIIISILS
jgi:hypothetical protein